MNTKEIDVWVMDSSLKNMEHADSNVCGLWVSDSRDSSHTLKAKLVIEIPEKKIEITESELDNITKRLGDCLEMNRIKKELGFNAT